MVFKSFCFCFLVLLSGFCQAARVTSVLIGAEDDWYPYSGVVNGAPRGLAEDIVVAAFRAVGIEAHFKPVPYSRCMAETRVGSLAACFDAVRNSMREVHYLWPDHPLYLARINIYGPASSTESNLTSTDLEGKLVAVTNEYEYGETFDADTKIERSVSDQDINGLRKLVSGRVNYMVLYEKVASVLVQKNPVLRGKFKVIGLIGQPGLYVVFSKNNPHAAALLNDFNAGFATIVKNGEYQSIADQWR